MRRPGWGYTVKSNQHLFIRVEAEFMFHRDKRHTLSSFIESNKKIDEEPDIEDEEEQPVAREEDYRRPVLDPMQQGWILNFM